MKKGILTLIPTPISNDLPLEVVALEQLQAITNFDQNIIIVEEHKAARRRWISWGLEREAIDQFFIYNEHNQQAAVSELLEQLRSGKNLFLLSDCGLPAFCDPGRFLVDACHRNNIKVTATPFPNSIALAIALSGLPHERFSFLGFPPRETSNRKQFFKESFKRQETIVFMDTPYRLKKSLDDIADFGREVFIAISLNMPEEQLFRGDASKIIKQIEGIKGPFIAVCA